MSCTPRATLAIVAYGQPDLVEDLLDSIVDNTPEAHEILVVDNASPDDTYERVQRHRSQPRLVKSERNLGYGGHALYDFNYTECHKLLCRSVIF